MRFLQVKFFSYKLVQGLDKPIVSLIEQIENFLDDGHYIIAVTEVKDEGLMLFYKHKSELDKNKKRS